MTSFPQIATERRETVALTRQDVEFILMKECGLFRDEVDQFWAAARELAGGVT